MFNKKTPPIHDPKRLNLWRASEVVANQKKRLTFRNADRCYLSNVQNAYDISITLIGWLGSFDDLSQPPLIPG